MKYTLEYCRKNKVAIEITSDREYFDVIKITGTNPIDNYSSTVRDKGDYQRIAIQVNDLWCSVKWYKDKGYEVITAQQFLNDNRIMKYKVGDKVVPINKTAGEWGNLKYSIWMGSDKKQGFLYITKIVCGTTSRGYADYICDVTESNSGDFFMESDLIPYVENNKLTENFGIRVEGEGVNSNAKEIVKWFTDNGFDTEGYGGSIDSSNDNAYYIENGKRLYYNWGINIPSNIKIYTLKEVLDMNTFVLPEKWCVKPKTPDEASIVFQFEGISKHYDSRSTVYYQHYPPFKTRCTAHDSIQEGYTEITFEQFKTYVLNQSNMKEIIGYICPQDLFNGEVPKGTVYVINGTKTSYVRKEKGSYNLPKEIVETREPVYAQEKIVSVGGKFDVKIKDGKIWHSASDITDFVKELVSYFNQTQEFGGYKAVISQVTFKSTGCQSYTTTLENWLEVWDTYKELNNG